MTEDERKRVSDDFKAYRDAQEAAWKPRTEAEGEARALEFAELFKRNAEAMGSDTESLFVALANAFVRIEELEKAVAKHTNAVSGHLF